VPSSDFAFNQGISLHMSELDLLSIEIDSAMDRGNASSLEALLEKCDSILDGEESCLKPRVYFYKANIYSSLSALRSHEPAYAWSWKQSEKVQEILNLRRAISDSAFPKLDPVFQCKVYTNLGNSLNQFGRFIEAIKSWNSALKLVPNFAMALGNKGIGLTHYAHALYDYGHAGVMIAHAVDEFKGAISKDALWDSGLNPEADKYFKESYLNIEEHLEKIEYRFDFDLDQWKLGDNKTQIDYRKWCLDNNLFLSPLNDVTKFSVSAQDVLLMNGFDGVQFNYRIEQLKVAFRLAYSIFDKVALFLNDYFDVGLKVNAVSFRKIWTKNKNKTFEINSCFEGSQNLPLRGLYYLSKDLFDDDFDDVALPEAKELAGLRNRIEHRYVSLQDYAASINNSDIHSYVSIDDFQLKTLRIMSMAREALVYLSLAMHREEEIRDIKNKKVSIPIHSSPIE